MRTANFKTRNGGPSKQSRDNNISNLLSGLKTREIDVNDKKNEANNKY